jgi:hypothetical protein
MDGSARTQGDVVPLHGCDQRKVIVSTDGRKLTSLNVERCKPKFIDMSSGDMTLLGCCEFSDACDTWHILAAAMLEEVTAEYFRELKGMQSLDVLETSVKIFGVDICWRFSELKEIVLPLRSG